MGIHDLLQATELQPAQAEAESPENRERSEAEEIQKELLDLQEQLMNILFPLRNIPPEEYPGMPREAMSGMIGDGELENEFDDLSEDISAIANDIGKELFEILLDTSHRVYETVTKQIIEEIIRTLLAKPEDLEHPPSTSSDTWKTTPLNLSDFKMDLFKDVDFFRSSLSFSEDRQDIQDLHASEDETTSNKIIESDSNSELSQEFNEDYRQQ